MANESIFLFLSVHHKIITFMNKILIRFPSDNYLAFKITERFFFCDSHNTFCENERHLKHQNVPGGDYWVAFTIHIQYKAYLVQLLFFLYKSSQIKSSRRAQSSRDAAPLSRIKWNPNINKIVYYRGIHYSASSIYAFYNFVLVAFQWAELNNIN